jgi:hypothetical protein
MEFFKELVSVLSGRVKSNIFGYTFLAFLIYNWRPLFFLLFSDASVLARLTFFDMKTDEFSLFFMPIISGIVLTIVVPWVNLAGAYAVAWPVRLFRGLQDIEALKTSLHKAELEAKLQLVIERKKIEEAKILDEAKGLENKEIREKFERDIEIGRRLSGDPSDAYRLLEKLDNFHTDLLLYIGASRQGKIRLVETRGSFVAMVGANEEKIAGRKHFLRLRDSLTFLSSLGLLAYNKMSGEHTMTSLGYEICDVANKVTGSDEGKRSVSISEIGES